MQGDGLQIKSSERLTVATIFCRVGTIPDADAEGAGTCSGVLAGVATPLGATGATSLPSDDGGERSFAPPGKLRLPGATKFLACWALDGWVVRVSIMMTIECGSDGGVDIDKSGDTGQSYSPRSDDVVPAENEIAI